MNVRRMLKGTGLPVLALLLFSIAGCGGGDDDEGGVAVTLADYSVTASPASAEPGEVTFDVRNSAGQVHEFVVAKTDLEADALPTGDDGDVEEEGSDVMSVVDEIEDLAGGDDRELTVTLEAGHYVLFCNLPGHYRQGMSTDFEVAA